MAQIGPSQTSSPYGILRVLGGIAGGLFAAFSVVKLVEFAIDVGISRTLGYALDYCDRLLTVLFQWAEPLIGRVLAAIGEVFDWRLMLNAHWKHIFVLLGVYFLRDVTATLGVGRPSDAVYLFTWALPIMIVASVGAGAVGIEHAYPGASTLVVAIPVIGVALYDFGKLLRYAESERLRTWVTERYELPEEPRRDYYARKIPMIVGGVLGVGLAAAWLGPSLPRVRGLPDPGLAVLLALIVVLTIRWLGAGAELAMRMRKHRVLKGEPAGALFETFLYTGAAKLGIAMGHVLVGAVALIVSNAGLSLAGL